MANFSNPSFETDVSGWVGGLRPSDIANNVFWVDASQEAYSNGANVGTATDRSGQANHATNTSGAGTPTFVTNVINGSSVYRFSNTNSDVLITPGFTWNQQSMIFFVTNNPTIDASYVFSVNAVDNQRVAYVRPPLNNMWAYAGGNLTSGTYDVSNAAITLIDFNNTSSCLYGNGNATLGTTGANNGTGVTMARNGNSGSNYNGDIAEMGVITGAVGTSDRKNLNSYLAFKYNIAMAEGGTAVRSTAQYYTGTASLKVVAIDNDTPFYEMINPGVASSFTLSCYAYIDGSTVCDNTYASLYYNGTAQTTTYADQGSGWTKLSCTVTGANALRKCGIVVKTTKTIYADVFDLSLAGGGAKSYNLNLLGVG